MEPKRAALYVRVGADGQTTGSQHRELALIAVHRGWVVVKVYKDAGVIGAKGHDRQSGWNNLLKDASRGRFDVVMAWSVDRLGRSLCDLVNGLQQLRSARVDLFLHQQSLDTTTATGRAMFKMCGVFAEFEHSMKVARVNAGMVLARTNGTRSGRPIGRPRITSDVEQRIREQLSIGYGILKVAAMVGVSSSPVQRVKKTMQDCSRGAD